MGPTICFMGMVDMGWPLRNKRRPPVGKSLVIQELALYNLHAAHNWLTMGITLAKTIGMPYQNPCLTYVSAYNDFTGHFMGRPVWGPSFTNMSQISDFTWAILRADQCEFHVMEMCGKWLYMRSFMGQPEWAPYNSNIWQDAGFT